MKISITIRFYEELNDFLPPENRKKAFDLEVEAGGTMKQAIESCGVPCPEVDLILADGRSVDLAYIPVNGDRISVYPVFERLDISSITRLREKPLREPRFICDVHLGRLAKYLRMLGFDTLYENDYTDDEIQRLADEQKRVILTRDRELLKGGGVKRGCLVRHIDARLQAREIISAFDLSGSVSPLSRCLVCNGVIRAAGKEDIRGRIDRSVLERHEEFFECMECGKVYWKGSHYDSMMGWIRGVWCRRGDSNSHGCTPTRP